MKEKGKKKKKNVREWEMNVTTLKSHVAPTMPDMDTLKPDINLPSSDTGTRGWQSLIYSHSGITYPEDIILK